MKEEKEQEGNLLSDEKRNRRRTSEKRKVFGKAKSHRLVGLAAHWRAYVHRFFYMHE